MKRKDRPVRITVEINLGQKWPGPHVTACVHGSRWYYCAVELTRHHGGISGARAVALFQAVRRYRQQLREARPRRVQFLKELADRLFGPVST